MFGWLLGGVPGPSKRASGKSPYIYFQTALSLLGNPLFQKVIVRGRDFITHHRGGIQLASLTEGSSRKRPLRWGYRYPHRTRHGPLIPNSYSYNLGNCFPRGVCSVPGREFPNLSHRVPINSLNCTHYCIEKWLI